ncbi:MAG TPA: glycosyltransferase family 2 protein [Acidimicrobiales bacterium]|nr:glycosyltransferase family 2 protein [Acidimicrobiales bacterium]
MNPTVAIVIPAFDEEASVASVVASVARYGTAVVVDDGSQDGTARVARGAGAHVISHDVNRGYDAALKTGFDWAVDSGHAIVVTLDADAQHDPERITALVSPIVEGRASAVLGVRPDFARPSERLFALYARHRYGVPDLLCGMKAFSSGAVERHRTALGRPSIGTGLALACLRAGEAVEVVAVPVRAREGPSRFGDNLSAEMRVLRALLDAVVADETDRPRPAALRHCGHRRRVSPGDSRPPMRGRGA